MYSRISLSNLNLGFARPADDILVLKDPEHPDWIWSASISELDGRYLEVLVSKDSSRVRTPSTLTLDPLIGLTLLT